MKKVGIRSICSMLILMFVLGIFPCVGNAVAYSDTSSDVKVVDKWVIKGEKFKLSSCFSGKWSTSDCKVVKIRSGHKGKKCSLKALDVGTAVISVKSGKRTKSFSVGVVRPELAIKNGFNYPGDTNMVAIAGMNHEAYNALSKYFTWKTSNKKVICIKNGWPLAVKPGVATLKLYYKGKFFDKVKVAVVEPREGWISFPRYS